MITQFLPSTKAPLIASETAIRTSAVIQLAPGVSLRRELAPNDPELVEVWVGQGRILRFTIEKGDALISAAVVGPGETRLVETVSEEFEDVELLCPADVTGSYRIEIKSREMTEDPKPIAIQLHQLVQITALGRKDSEARQVMGAAEVLVSAWTKSSLDQAIDKFDKATLIWTSISDYSKASAAAIKAGDVCFRLSKYPEAFQRFENAVKLSKQSGDRISEGRALSRVGHLHSYTGDNDRASTALDAALTLLESGCSNSGSLVAHAHAEAVSNMAEVVYAKGNFVKARRYLEQAGRALGKDRKGQARIHLFASYIAGSTGQWEKVGSEISTSRALYQAAGDKAGEGLSLIAQGLSYSTKRKDDEALRLYRDALLIFQSIGDRHSEALVLNAMGQALENRGDHPAALHNYESAFKLFEAVGAMDFAIAALYKIGVVHYLDNDFVRAVDAYQRSLALSRKTRKIRLEALVLEAIALVYNAQGKSGMALNHYQTIQNFYQMTGDIRGLATALNNSGDFLLKLGENQKALSVYRRALHLSDQVGDTGTLLTTLYNLAHAHLKLGSLSDALKEIKDSIKIIEDLRNDVGSPDLRALYFAVVRKHYNLWVEILMELHRANPNKKYDVEALQVSDLSRARTLIDLLTEQHGSYQSKASTELLERERELRGLISAQAQYALELSLKEKNVPEIAEVANEIAQLRSQYQGVRADLWRLNPNVNSALSVVPINLEEIQKELRDSNTMLLQYSLGEDRSYLWAVTSESISSYELPARGSIEDAVREVYPLFIARQTSVENNKGNYQSFVTAADEALPEKAGNLSQMLLGQVAGQLATRKLLIVAEGALQFIPFEALPAPGSQLSGPENWNAFTKSLLINTNEISSSPSISLLRAIRSEHRPAGSTSRTVAVIADPVFSEKDERVRPTKKSSVDADVSPDEVVDNSTHPQLEALTRGGSLSRLTYSAKEADAISAAAPPGTTMVVKGFDASRETLLKARVDQYQIVHLATHAFLNSEHPELSGIVLTMVDLQGGRQNGLIPLSDVYSLNLSAELTVLSACQTALGKDVSGEGFLGLTHSFLSAGSKSVVASLWKVDDQATASLMTHFYEALFQKNMTTGEALRAAKLEMLKEGQWSPPYYWAGFVLQGEYTNRIAVDNSRRWYHSGWLAAIAFLVVTSIAVFIGWRKLMVHR